MGDAQARSDVEVLAAAGLVDDVTTQWPLPWAAVLRRLNEIDPLLENEPEYIRAAARRLEEESEKAVQVDHTHYGMTADVTNSPAVVRGFDALGRENVQSQAYMEWVGESTVVNLQVGAQTLNRYDRQPLLLDNTYIAQRIGGIAVYVGYVSHWWGPGWDTALSLSNNARPFPQIGYRRVSTAPFSSPWLSWLGPWNHEHFFGVLDGPRVAEHTYFHGMKWTFNPLHGFEIGLEHLQELCGTGHPCIIPLEFFEVQNSTKHPDKAKSETDIDLRYTNTFRGMSYAIYTQEMNRDTGPFLHSDTSHLFGASLWVPFRETALRFTAEFASTISTVDFFSFGNYTYGITYNDYKYIDGWQYRGRTLGSSLDTDSQLASFHASWAAPNHWTYTLSYYRAWVGSPSSPYPTTSVSGYPNRVTTAPVVIDVGEARMRIPFRNFSFDIGVRLQDDQPRPDKGFTAAAELALNYRL